MRRHLFLVALTVGIVLAYAYLAFYLHQQVKEQVLLQFSESQLQIVQQVTGQIESYLDARSQEIRHLALLTSLRHVDLKAIPSDVEARFAGLKREHVEEVSVLDATGKVVYSSGGLAIGSDYTRSDVSAWAKDPLNKEMVRLAMENVAARLSIATPLYQPPVAGSPWGPDATFAGVLLLRVDLETLAEGTLLFTPTTKESRSLSIWAMDENGTLLVHSDHPEMVSRNIGERTEECRRCHVSFDYAAEMLTTNQGTVDYQVKGQETKAAAFATLNFENMSWVVVVNAPKDDVTGFIQANFLETMGLLGLVGLVLAVAFFFAYRNSQQATVIEEEARYLDEKQKLVEKLREAGEYLENLFDSASAPIIVWNPALRIIRFNPACERLTGHAAGEVIGQELGILFPEASRAESLSKMIPASGREELESQEIPILRKDGETRIVLWNAANILAADGATVVATVAQGQDITERTRAEENLRKADHQLREQAALVKLGEMAAVVAHEVRNPLAGVRGALQVIGGRLPSGNKDAPIIRDMLARLDMLNDLTKDLLLFARPPHVSLAPVDIMALLRETTTLVSEDPAVRDVRFEVEGSAPFVVADAKLLKIVLLNLVLNASQAVQNSGTIRTAVTATESACRIVVADTGSGIPLEIRDQIFMPFFTTKTRGTGLGLSTAKRLVDAHHGRISVECPQGGGTVVTVELPRDQSAYYSGQPRE